MNQQFFALCCDFPSPNLAILKFPLALTYYTTYQPGVSAHTFSGTHEASQLHLFKQLHKAA